MPDFSSDLPATGSRQQGSVQCVAAGMYAMTRPIRLCQHAATNGLAQMCWRLSALATARAEPVRCL